MAKSHNAVPDSPFLIPCIAESEDEVAAASAQAPGRSLNRRFRQPVYDHRDMIDDLYSHSLYLTAPSLYGTVMF